MNRDNQQERSKQNIKVPERIGWYFAGFIDGEGSFNISLRKKSDYKQQWQPVLSFNVSQREKTVLTLMQHYFQCGIIKKRKDGLHSFDITNPIEIQEKIIPFFTKYNFLSSNKNHNFKLFKKAVKIMYKKEHLNKDGLIKLLEIRENLNQGKGRTRKYSINDVLESSETTRQTSHK
ncbi:hypothetical protein A2382_02370 [Candidatus Woesebacteria bacterium RIFOXYB1_FULL_38_16]|uniref:Homing endonuclease LAGLIDADG domain-containing protein n=1 Tax=Candidatus Woesebacteria bacterium RIFOXYB1_FULL_38_16 TaxID=1802538 RepID=A0A1F8CRA1_9BACT|nr:MAG: hypothetical protein A2191_04535 [Candidatus Woesebacteria bacterium RIFOXYA1_FULL_38_9]OGM78873.1 MAG: hypothetical protein A2382_02370 [Candidatus Woesebacteria bacterium RIFOXYB1_FULL_38_16]